MKQPAVFTPLAAAGYKFFPAYLWLVTKTLSRQREFMIAEQEGQVGYYNFLTPLYAAFHEDEKTFSLMWTEYDDDFSAFHAEKLGTNKMRSKAVFLKGVWGKLLFSKRSFPQRPPKRLPNTSARPSARPCPRFQCAECADRA